MSEEKKLKVSDLPEQEQKEILQQAYAAGLKGTFNGWKVETLKQKIKEAQTPAADETKDAETSTTESEKEQETEINENEQADSSTNKQNIEQEKQIGEETVETEPEKPEEPPAEKEPEQIKKEEQTQTENKQNAPEVAKPKNKGLNGICHICGSRVENGICTGCKFFR